MNEYYIGIDLGGTNLKTAIFNRDYIKICEKRVPTQVRQGSAHVLNRIVETILLLLTEQNLTRENIQCAGIAVPGLMDPEKGIAFFSPNFPDWENVPIAQSVGTALGFPVFIDHDVRSHLYGEWKLGAARGKKNVVLMALGTGVGSGVMVDGHMLYGATSSAGEIGHMNMYRQGRPCKCGSSGCLGRYVSAVGLVNTLKKKLNQGAQSIVCEWVQNDHKKITAKMISLAFDEGDAAAIEVFNETAEVLGYGIANAINLYNPETVIIGGGLSNAGERLLGRAREVVGEHALEIPHAACSIVTAELGDCAGMFGAAVFSAKRMENS